MHACTCDAFVLVSGAYMDESSLPTNSMKTVVFHISSLILFFSASRDEKTNLFSVFCFCAGSIVFFSCFLNAPIAQTATISSFPMVPASGFPNRYSRRGCMSFFSQAIIIRV